MNSPAMPAAALQSSPQVTVEGLTRHFHSQQTLTAYADIDLAIAAGEFFCIVGPSGCGKTSLMRAIAGLDQPTQGRVHIAAGAADAPARIGMVFQEHGLFPWMTLKQNITFLLKNNDRFHRADIDRISAEYLHSVGLAKFASYYPHQVSGGMRQRVSLARSFANAPDILLMDEPFVYLDYQTRLALQALLLDIWRESGKTVVFVTHDIDEAVLLADRVMMMSRQPGRVKKILPIDLPRPRDPFAIRADARYAAYVSEIVLSIREELAELEGHCDELP